MAVGKRPIGPEVELDAVHPLRAQLGKPGERWRRARQFRREEPLHHLHGQRRHMIVAKMPPDQTPNYYFVGAANPKYEGQGPFVI